MYSSKLFKKRIVIVVLLFIFIILFWMSGAYKLLSFDAIKRNSAWLKEQAQLNTGKTILCYIGGYIGLVVCSLPGVSLVNIMGGFLFGLFLGIVCIVVAATIGATIFFLMIRYVIGDLIQKKYAQKLHHFNQKIDKNGWIYLLLLRCIPLVPFFLVNILAAMTTIKLSTFIWTTALGVLPSAIVFAYIGTQFMNITGPSDIFSFSMVLAFTGLLALILTPVILSRYWKIV